MDCLSESEHCTTDQCGYIATQTLAGLGAGVSAGHILVHGWCASKDDMYGELCISKHMLCDFPGPSGSGQ